MSKRIHIDTSLDNAVCYGTYTMTLRDRNANIIKQGTYEIHSFVQQYWQFLYNTIRSSASNSYRRIDNLGNSDTTHMSARSGNGGASDARGIAVGTSSTAVGFTNNALGGYIASGSSANQLLYGASVVGYDPSTGKATITQTFTNNNATTDPAVNEVGIGIKQTATDGPQTMIIRDVPGSTYVVLFEAVLTVSYEIQFPFGCQNYHMMFARHQIARNTANMELYDSNGALVSSASFGTGGGAFGFVGDVGSSTRGIVVGSGQVAEALNTFALNTTIEHGINTGELFYYDSTHSSLETESTATNTSRFFLSRAYKNKSNTDVNICEVGLLSNATIGSTNFTYLFDRRLVSPNIVVEPDETVTLTWAFRYQFT
jgi:hypothetical protein